MNSQMFNSFLDGTKSAIEMAAVANACGLAVPAEGLAFPPFGAEDLARWRDVSIGASAASYVLDDRTWALPIDAAAYHQELVTSPADEGVGRPTGMLQELPHLQQRQVTSGVTVDVVELLQAVEIDHQEEKIRGQRAWALAFLFGATVASLHQRQVLLDMRHQEAAVPEAGQRVGETGFLELLVGDLQLFVALGQLQRPQPHLLLQRGEDGGSLPTSPVQRTCAGSQVAVEDGALQLHHPASGAA